MNTHFRAALFFVSVLTGCSSGTKMSFGSDHGDASTGGQDASNGGSGNGGSGASGGARAGSGGGGAGSGGIGGAGGTGSGGREICLVCGGMPGSGGAPPSARCPSTQPIDGESCTGAIGPCSYGDHPLTYCRANAGCANGKWTVTPVPDICTQLSSGCPASEPSGACDTPNTVSCIYRTAACSCTVCCSVPGCNVLCGNEPQGTKVWGCAPALQGNEFCPGVTPNQGAPCELPSGTACLTNSCGLNVTCENGAWKWEYKNDFSCQRVCASPNTPIATPEGERAIAELRPGDLVYSVDHDAIVAVPIASVRRVHVENHSVLKIALEGGRSLEISPLHPDAEGILLGNLHAGDVLERTRIERVSLIPYTHDSTYDILPASDTGTYFAAGVLIGSTLKSETVPRSAR